MNRIIGIDLGTTKSVVGYCSDDGKPIIIPFNDKPFLESSIYISSEKKVFVGKQAQKMQLKEITNENKGFLIEAVKRRVGKESNTKVGNWEDYPQYLYAHILAELKYQAEQHLGHAVHDAIIAIPSHFDINQRRATKEAAELVGLNVTRLLNEATASSLAYVARHNIKHDENVLIFDFGGGTLDISIIVIGEGVYEVKCIEGDSEIGGIDYSFAVEEIFYEQLKKELGKSIELNDYEKYILNDKIEKAKIELSSDKNAIISLNTTQGLFNICIKRSTLEINTEHITNKVRALLMNALREAEFENTDIDKVVMIGRSSNLSFIKDTVYDVIGSIPILFANEITCVAEGAIIKAGALEGKIKDVLLLDVTPKNLGIETHGGVMTTLIGANTTIPTQKNETFTTVEDNQQIVEVKVFEGNNSMVKDNHFLQSVFLEGISPAPKNVPQIEVTFDIDANGLLEVSAKDKSTGKESYIRCEVTHSLPAEQFEHRKEKLTEWLENK